MSARQRCVQVEVPIGGKRRRPIDGCVTAIARFCDCKVWVSRDTMMPSYVFFGFDADTALAGYLFTVIDRAMGTELTAFRAAHPRLRGVGLRGASKSFQQGMAARVADRLDEMHRARDASVAAQRSTGTALILVKHQVVEDAFRETEIRLVSAGRLSRARLNGAFRQGLAAGDRVNLNRPVGDAGRLADMTDRSRPAAQPRSTPGRSASSRHATQARSRSHRRRAWWMPSGLRWDCAFHRRSSLFPARPARQWPTPIG